MASRSPQVLLPVADLARSLRFYLEQAGFAPAGEPESDDLATVVGPGGVPLLLAGPAADRSAAAAQGLPVARPHAWVYLHRPDLDGLAAELTDRGLTPEGPGTPYPGWRQLTLADPDGYLLVFWETPPLSDSEMLELYRGGPGRLAASVHGLADDQLDRAWMAGKWSLRELVHHLVDSDLSTFQVIRTALALPGRTVTSDTWAPDDWMAAIGAGSRPVAPAVALFAAQRAWVLEAVAHLPGALSRWVQWPSGYRAEVRDLLRQAGGHALHHILQIERARSTR